MKDNPVLGRSDEDFVAHTGLKEATASGEFVRHRKRNANFNFDVVRKEPFLCRCETKSRDSEKCT
jgi:hypothetical protein